MKLKKRDGCICRNINDETLILNVQDDSIYTLSKVGSFIWKLFDLSPELSIFDIKNEVIKQYSVEEAILQRDIDIFLENMSKYKLLETVED